MFGLGREREKEWAAFEASNSQPSVQKTIGPRAVTTGTPGIRVSFR